MDILYTNARLYLQHRSLTKQRVKLTEQSNNCGDDSIDSWSDFQTLKPGQPLSIITLKSLLSDWHVFSSRVSGPPAQMAKWKSSKITASAPFKCAGWPRNQPLINFEPLLIWQSNNPDLIRVACSQMLTSRSRFIKPHMPGRQPSSAIMAGAAFVILFSRRSTKRDNYPIHSRYTSSYECHNLGGPRFVLGSREVVCYKSSHASECFWSFSASGIDRGSLEVVIVLDDPYSDTIWRCIHVMSDGVVNGRCQERQNHPPKRSKMLERSVTQRRGSLLRSTARFSALGLSRKKSCMSLTFNQW